MRATKLIAGIAGLATMAIAAASPAEAQYRGWSPGAAAAVGVLGGLAVGGAIASTAPRPAYGPPVGYYAPPPAYPAYGECYVVHRRVWVPGWGWDVRPREICD